MPFPWKKARVSRISKLMGGSLVVETGFPTSLIDLFVKNKDRLKKPSSKKRKKRIQISDPVTISAPPIDLRLNSDGSDTFWGSAVSRIQSFGCRDYEESRNVTGSAGGLVDDQVVVSDGGGGVGGGGGNGGGKRGREVFWAILKMFIVVVLALGTKKLAVGITMSAFVLLLFEYVGTRLVCLLKPCLNMQIVMALNSSLQRVFVFAFPCFWRKQGEILLEEEKNRGGKGEILSDEISSKSNDDLQNPTEEIEIIETKMDSVLAPVGEIQTLKPDYHISSGSGERRWGYEEDPKKSVVIVEEEDRDGGGEVLEQRNHRTRRSKLKSKIKKLVPKKFRSSNKEQPGKEKEFELKEPESSCSEISSCVGEDKLGRCREQEMQEDEEDKSSMSLSKQEGCCIGEEEEESYDGISSSGELSNVVVSEKVGREIKGNSGYLILLLIVLAGLVGGRVVALFVIIGWCFMVKSVKILRRFAFVPSMRSPV